MTEKLTPSADRGTETSADEAERALARVGAERALARGEAERALAREAERVSLALDAGAIIGTWDWDLTRDSFVVDERFAQSFGLDPALGREGLSLAQVVATVHPEDVEGLNAAIADVVARGGRYAHQYRVRRADGRYYWIEANGRVDKDAAGVSVRFPGVLLDVEGRRAVEGERDRALALLRSFTEAVPGVVYAKDRDGRLLVGNRGVAELVGKPLGEIIGRTDAEFLDDPAQAAAAMANDRRVMERGIPEQVEERVDPPGGRRAVWLSTKAPLRDDQGTVIGLIGSSVDITARKDAEEALSQTTRRLNAILANTREAVFLMDERQHCVFANAAAEALTGYPFAAMQGRPLHDVVHHKKPDGSHYPLEECPIDRAFPERAQVSGEELFVAPDGSFYPVAFTASPVLDDDGRPIGTVIEARAIAEEKAASARLAQMAAVGEQSRDFIGVADLTGMPVYVNPAGRAMMGLPDVDAACAVNLLEYFAPDDRALIRDEALPAAHREGYWEGEVRFRRFDDGREFPVLYNLFPVRDAHGVPTHLATVTRDLTEKKNIEAELRRWNATLEERVAAAVAEREKAEEALRQSQKMEAVGQLTGGIAHDFNNLLTVVTGNIDMTLRTLEAAGVSNPRARRMLESAMKGAERAAALTQRLLAFSRRQPLAPKPLDADRLVAGMSDLLSRALGETVRLEVVTSPGLWRVEADPNQLESAILNLGLNARDAMPKGGTLTVETANARIDDAYAAQHAEVAPGQYVVIAVTDTGHGMSRDTLARAFEPFFTTKEVGKGTGLGLSQVYGFTKQSGGHIKIYSEEGRGTTVKLYLPRLAGGQETEPGPADAPGLEASRARETILAVEDDDDVRAYTVDCLRELGYRVLEAADGAAALRLAERHGEPIDLLFTDVVMPGMSGQELAEALRGRQPDLRVLYTSGYTRNAIVHGGRLDEGVVMIAKPFTFQALSAKVRDMLETGRARRVLVAAGDAALRAALVEGLGRIGCAADEAANAPEALMSVRAAQGRFGAMLVDMALLGAGETLAVQLRALHADLPLLVIGGAGAVLPGRLAADRCTALLPAPFTDAALADALMALNFRCAAGGDG